MAVDAGVGLGRDGETGDGAPRLQRLGVGPDEVVLQHEPEERFDGLLRAGEVEELAGDVGTEGPLEEAGHLPLGEADAGCDLGLVARPLLSEVVDGCVSLATVEGVALLAAEADGGAEGAEDDVLALVRDALVERSEPVGSCDLATGGEVRGDVVECGEDALGVLDGVAGEVREADGRECGHDLDGGGAFDSGGALGRG
ncbi:hypothetical protein ACI3KS_17030, partial [Microbacterium sp. ZW T5_45]|uniref:hypothetical protein n=1 Tax=Microbacterium sp. ZW T5_45 TaxID=3378080 RepID=UPI003854678E